MPDKRRNGASWGPPATSETMPGCPATNDGPISVASESYDPGYETFNELPAFGITKAQVKDGYTSYGFWNGEAGSDKTR